MTQIQLAGIDCAACATKIETNVKKLPQVQDCAVNFATQKLSYELTGDQAATAFELELQQLLTTIEPDVTIQKSLPAAGQTPPKKFKFI